MGIEHPAVDHHLIQIISNLGRPRIPAPFQLLDHGGKVNWVLDLFVVIGQGDRIDWFSKDLGELLLDEAVDHAKDLLLQSVLRLELVHKSNYYYKLDLC